MQDLQDWVRLFEHSGCDSDEQILVIRDHLLGYCQFLSGSCHDAEDIVQTTLLKALPVLQGHHPHPNLGALLQRIAKNTWLDHVRKHGRCQPYNPAHLADICGSHLSEDRLESEEAIRTLVQWLTPMQRIAILLCDVFRFTDVEAAQRMGTSKGAVKSALHRARARLERRDEQPSGVVSRRPDVQDEILRAYVAAFQSADVAALIHLCEGGLVDPVRATSQVLTLAERRTKADCVSDDPMSVRAAA